VEIAASASSSARGGSAAVRCGDALNDQLLDGRRGGRRLSSGGVLCANALVEASMKSVKNTRRAV
jgi:hypothetical protein